MMATTANQVSHIGFEFTVTDGDDMEISSNVEDHGEEIDIDIGGLSPRDHEGDYLLEDASSIGQRDQDDVMTDDEGPQEILNEPFAQHEEMVQTDLGDPFAPDSDTVPSKQYNQASEHTDLATRHDEPQRQTLSDDAKPQLNVEQTGDDLTETETRESEHQNEHQSNKYPPLIAGADQQPLVEAEAELAPSHASNHVIEQIDEHDNPGSERQEDLQGGDETNEVDVNHESTFEPAPLGDGAAHTATSNLGASADHGDASYHSSLVPEETESGEEAGHVVSTSPIHAADNDEETAAQQAASVYAEHESDSQSASHPLVIVYQANEISLFPPKNSDSSETYFLSDSSLLDRSILDLLSACRNVLGETITNEDELEMGIEELGLYISEDCKHAASTTLSEILDVYLQLHSSDDTSDNGPMYLLLTTKTRFSARLENLLQAARSGKGYSELTYLDHHTDEGEETSNAAAEREAGADASDTAETLALPDENHDEASLDIDGKVPIQNTFATSSAKQSPHDVDRLEGENGDEGTGRPDAEHNEIRAASDEATATAAANDANDILEEHQAPNDDDQAYLDLTESYEEHPAAPHGDSTETQKTIADSSSKPNDVPQASGDTAHSHNDVTTALDPLHDERSGDQSSGTSIANGDVNSLPADYVEVEAPSDNQHEIAENGEDSAQVDDNAVESDAHWETAQQATEMSPGRSHPQYQNDDEVFLADPDEDHYDDLLEESENEDGAGEHNSIANKHNRHLAQLESFEEDFEGNVDTESRQDGELEKLIQSNEAASGSAAGDGSEAGGELQTATPPSKRARDEEDGENVASEASLKRPRSR